MDKPRSLRILAVAAALVSLLGIMLNTVVVLNPHIAAILLGYGNVKEMMDAKLNSGTVTLMMIQAFIPALMTILCGINIFADKVSKPRSTFTLIAGPAAYIAVSYTHLRAHETPEHLVCRLLLEKKKTTIKLKKNRQQYAINYYPITH